MENKYLFVVFCCLLSVNLFSVCGTATVTTNEGVTVNETPVNETSKVETKCQSNDTECQKGEATIVEEPVSNLVTGNETKIELETTTEYDNILNETTTITVETDNITIIPYYYSFDNDTVNDTDNQNLTDLIDQENSTQIELMTDDNSTDTTTMITLSLNETDTEFTTVNSTVDDSFSTVNTTETVETTVKTEERDTTEVENTSTVESAENATVTTTIATEIINTTELTEEVSQNSSSTTNSSTTSDTTTTASSSSINGTEEEVNSTIASSSMASNASAASSEDINTLTPASHTKAEEDHEQQLKLFIPIGVVGILILVGFIAYFLVRKMKKTATYECEPYS